MAFASYLVVFFKERKQNSCYSCPQGRNVPHRGSTAGTRRELEELFEKRGCFILYKLIRFAK